MIAMCSMFSWPIQLVSSQGMLAGVRGWGEKNSEVREVKRGWSIGSTGDVGRGSGKLQLVICCSTRDIT